MEEGGCCKCYKISTYVMVDIKMDLKNLSSTVFLSAYSVGKYVLYEIVLLYATAATKQVECELQTQFNFQNPFIKSQS